MRELMAVRELPDFLLAACAGSYARAVRERLCESRRRIAGPAGGPRGPRAAYSWMGLCRDDEYGHEQVLAATKVGTRHEGGHPPRRWAPAMKVGTRHEGGQPP